MVRFGGGEENFPPTAAPAPASEFAGSFPPSPQQLEQDLLEWCPNPSNFFAWVRPEPKQDLALMGIEPKVVPEPKQDLACVRDSSKQDLSGD